MAISVLIRSVLTGLVLVGARSLAQAQEGGGCQDDSLAPPEQRAACDTEIAAATDPVEKATLLVARAGTYRREGDPAGAVDALADLAEAERLAPDMDPRLRADLLIERAEAHASEGDTETALAELGEAEQLAPDNAAPAIIRGLILSGQGDFEGALAELARAREINPDDPRALFESMVMLRHAGDAETCAELGERAVEVTPSDAPSWSVRGLCLAMLGREVEAMESFAEAERLGPEDPGIHADKAEALLALGRPDEAVAAARRAVELEPGWSGPRMALVNALIGAGQPEEAVATYHEAIAAGAENPSEQANNLAWSLYMAGESERAVPIMEAWREEFPKPEGGDFYHYTLDTAAHVMAAAGREDEAVELFLEAAELGGPTWRGVYEEQLTALGHTVEPGEEGFEAALRACVATGEACKLFSQ